MACRNACPKGAISAVKDEKGFLYPHVDPDKCIDCHLCEQVCAFTKADRNDALPRKAYSFIHKDKKTLLNSTSGGAFTALSDSVLSAGGVVFGAMMDEQFSVRHTEARDRETRDKMRGSLYTQSDTGTVYGQVKECLEMGKEVMFVGSPCQVGGLIGFLRKPYDNLIAVEFLCHGVPNNDFFKAHIHWLEKKYAGKAVWYTFRSKKFAWWPLGIEEITFDNGVRKSTQPVQSYNRFFHSNVSLRPSCLNCTYRKLERCADITIADFWGIEKITGRKNATGASMVLCNTEKGMEFTEKIDRNAVEISEVPFEKVKYRIATKPAKPSKDTVRFWQVYLEKGYEGLTKKYTDTSLKGKILFGAKKIYRKTFLGSHTEK